jgi:hypothetical protein
MLEGMRAAKLLLCASTATVLGCSLGLGGIGRDSPAQDAQAGDDGSFGGGDAGGGNDADGGGVSDAAVDGGPRDGSGLDAPPPNDGGNDGSPLNPSLCDDAGFLLCDGFENGIDAAVWTVNTSQEGHLAAGSTYVYRGAKALHASTDAFGGALDHGASAQLHHHDGTWPALLYVREFVYLPKLLPDNYATLMTVGQYANAPLGVQLNIVTGTPNKWAQTIFNDGADDGDWHSQSAMAIGQWTCVEMKIDSGSGDVRVFVAGTEITALNHNIGMVTPTLDALAIGLYFFNPAGWQPAADVWVDEVAVNGSMIACSQ